jgi:4-amino-4-deoxy-L-arabinose transferase-like glycosyltransferase
MKDFSFSENQFKIFIIFFALLIGILVRFPYLTSKDEFPFGDGGLFVEMIYAIKNNNYFLPSYVNYSGHEIPFAYPPFGFYLALLSARVFGISILESVQILPVIINVFTMIAFVFLAAELTKDKIELFLSSGIFSIVLQTYLWTVKGGGLSRSPGFLFTTLTIYLFLLYQRKEKRLYLILSAIAFGLATASHLEWGLITLASFFVFILYFGRYKTKQDMYNLLIFGIVSLLITLPWWGTVIYKFGITPFINAWNVAEMDINQFFGKFFSGAMFRATIFSAKDYFLPIFGVIGFISVLASKERRLLSIWLLITYIVAPKNSPISGLLPLVILIAVGLRNIDKASLYLFEKLKITLRQNFQPNISILYLFGLIFLSVPQLFNKPILTMLSPLERTAMEYVSINTPSDAKFIVLTPNDWHSADAAEWFPYLAQRQSLTTPQGLEWVSTTEFNKIVEQVTILSQLMRNEQSGIHIGQLVNHVEANFTDYDYVAIFANNIESNFGGFMETDNYEIFYRKNDILILRRLK